ncbi:hypothetical protein LIER_09744 [Lithospermum erythrorhizon]|uniref:GAG-pre-integrase domain-containing protein n=1 Tax=Lithospermum erythrorhizon TaxID=34254 RepID=A0AAV3PGZ4_LITER
MISADEFAKFILYQDSLKGSSTPTSALGHSGNQNTCLISSSSKFIIDTGATDHMSDLMSNEIISRGHECGGLYMLDMSKPTPLACSSVTSPYEAHCRLGHPSLSSLKKLCPQFIYVSILDCESCQFAKHHRVSSSPLVNK